MALNGNKVRLRPKQIEDAVQDYTWSQDKELCDLEAVYPISISFADYRRLYALELEHRDGSYQHFAIETTAGEHIGNCMIYGIDHERGDAELGIILGNRVYWGQGYGTEAISLLLEHVFTATGLQRIYLHTLEENLRAQRCFQKCGFVVSRAEPRWGRTFVLMEIDRPSWQQNNLKRDSPPPEAERSS